MPDIAPLAAEIRFVLNRLNRRLRYQQVGDDLTISQLSVIWLLVQHGRLTAGDLAAKEHVRPPSMTRIIAALEQLGMVERQDHPKDGRQVVVCLTETGRRRADAESAARNKWLSQRLVTETTASERTKIAEVLAILNRIVDTDQRPDQRLPAIADGSLPVSDGQRRLTGDAQRLPTSDANATMLSS